jgi:hypothetical protein
MEKSPNSLTASWRAVPSPPMRIRGDGVRKEESRPRPKGLTTCAESLTLVLGRVRHRWF